MVLLSGMMRWAAITGRTDYIPAWCAGRQGGRWAEQTIRSAFPTAAPQAQRTRPAGGARARADPAEALRELTELHQRGVVTDAEFEALRARLRV
jgi:Short C-terminal domain